MASDTPKAKEPSISTRRVSNMSIGNTGGSIHSSSNDSTADHHHEEYEDYEPEIRENRLRPTVSRASSTNAVGNVIPSLDRTWTGGSTLTNSDPALEIDFDDGDDQANPRNWPLWYKCLVIGLMSYGTTCVVLFSTSYTSAIPGMEKAFGISTSEGILGVTTYLLGMATGSVILAPLSEMYGRRPVYILAIGIFILFVLPCALARNIETILVTRFLGAFCAAALVSNAPGSVNDIVEEQHRALAFSVWSIGPLNGPVSETRNEACSRCRVILSNDRLYR